MRGGILAPAALAVLFSCAVPVAGAIPSGTPADSVLTDPGAAEPWRVRGTIAPLERHDPGGRKLVRGLAHVAYAPVWLVVKPVGALVAWDERAGVSRTVLGWFTRDVRPFNTEVAAYLGYETGFGMTVLGLRVHSRDWYGTGLESRFRASWLDTRKNIAEIRFEGGAADGWSFATRTRFRRVPGREFRGYGRGDGSIETEWDSQLFLNELQMRHPLVAGLDGALLAYTRATRVLDHQDDGALPSDPEVWRRTGRNLYVGLEGELRRDTRDAGEMSSRGTLVRLTAGWNAAREGDDADYRHLGAELQWHAPLFRDRSLAARVAYEGVDPDDPTRLPLSELRGLGGHHDLRGFPRDRFVDLHRLAMSLEYRYPVTTRFQGRLFSDWGTVAPSLDGLDLGDLAFSAGLGLVFPLADGELFVIQYARGREGGHLYAGTSTPFGSDSRRKR